VGGCLGKTEHATIKGGERACSLNGSTGERWRWEGRIFEKTRGDQCGMREGRSRKTPKGGGKDHVFGENEKASPGDGRVQGDLQSRPTGVR